MKLTIKRYGSEEEACADLEGWVQQPISKFDLKLKFASTNKIMNDETYPKLIINRRLIVI